MNRRKILILDDEPSIRRTLRLNLEPKGFEVEEAQSAVEGLTKLAAFKPHLIILDLGLPDKNGETVLSEIREWSKIPILVLTVSDDEASKVKLLEAGADDYITKPFSIAELIARLHVALRRQGSEEELTPVFTFDDIKVDLNKREVVRQDERVHLTATEMNLLRVLVTAKGVVVSQEQILSHVWGNIGLENPHYLRIYIGQLRKKLEKDPSTPEHILTEPGVGYRMV